MLWIFTLSYNGKSKLERLYNSFNIIHKGTILSEYFPDFKWMIKDNGSSDGSDELVNSWKNENIILYKYPNNLQNFSQGNNWLFEKVDPKEDDFILLLNNDIIFGDLGRSIIEMINIISDEKVGIVGSKLNYIDRPNILQHAGVLFHPRNIGTPFNYRAGSEETDNDKQNREFPMTTGAAMLTRAAIYKQIGGLNEKLNWCWEDCWYCLEVGSLGKKVVVCGNTKILHEESATLNKNPQQKMFFHQNLKIFTNKWKDKIDKSLVNKYDQDSKYMMYKNA